MTSLADVFVEGRVDTSRFGSDIHRGMSSAGVTGAASSAGKTTGGRFSSAFGSAMKGIAAPLLATVGTVQLVSFFKGSIAEAREAQKASALTGAVIKSTGGIAGVTTQQVTDLANAISLKTGIDDEAVQSGENLLLTFKNIHDEVGKGNDIFDRATQSVVDMSAALGQDMKSGSIQLGKALNDPIKGITALSRVGVTFTEQQKTQIKTLVESGDSLKAQKIILHELASEFGGAAAAQATFGDKASVAWKNFQEEVGTAVLPLLDDLERWFATDGMPILQAGLRWVETDGVDAFHSFVGAVKPIVSDLLPALADSAVGVFDALKVVAPVVLDLVHGFGALPDPVKEFIIVAGLGAVAVSKLSTAFAGMKLTGFIGQLANAETRTAALGKAAKAAAGGAGIALLIDASQRGGTAVGDLETVAGAAAVGFTAAGPWGGAIGGAIGALKVFTSGSDDAARAQQHLSTLAGQLADTLNTETGALTAASKEKLFQDISDSGLIDAAKKFGVSAKLIIDFSTGVAAAQDKMTKKLAAAIPVEPIKLSSEAYAQLSLTEQSAYDNRRRDFESAQAAFTKFRDSITGERDAVNQSTKDWIAHRKAVGLNIVDAQDYRAALLALPKEARTAIRAEGMDITLNQAQQLFDRYKVLPKEQSTLLRALGFDQAASLIDNTVRKLKDLGNQHPMPRVDINTGGAYASLRAIQSQLLSLHDKTITVNVNTGAIGHLKDGGLVGRFAPGGFVSGPGGPRDDRIQAMLSNGEFVVNAAATSRHLGLLHQINAQHFAAGGAVSAGDQRAADQALAQAIRALERQIKHFDVKPGDTASDSRSMVNALAAALRDVVGKDSPLLKHFRALGDHLVDVQKRQDKLGDRYDKAAGQLKATLTAQHQYASTVAAAFTHDAFGGSLADLKLQVRADTNDARTADRALDRARRMGLSGAALRQLAVEGNTALDVEVSHLGRHGIRDLEAMLRGRTLATSRLGAENAQALYGDRRQAETKVLHELGGEMKHLRVTLNDWVDRLEKAAERGTHSGARRGNADRELRSHTKRAAR